VVRLAAAIFAVVASGFLWSSGEEVRVIEIDIEHSAFVPARISVEQGETVRFVVRNGDPIDHEFLIGDEAMQQIHEGGTEAHHGARPGEISIPALEVAETTFEFSDSADLIFGCHLPTHYDFGMRGEIIVES
jgi:uncharacterized cupredoxin-like copper-binding protein